MSLTFGEGVETAGVWSCVGRLNPVAKLGITAVITIGLLLTLDHTTAGIILFFEIITIPFMGLRLKSVLVRAGVLVVLASILTLVNALFSGNAEGTVWFAWGPFSLSSAGLLAGLAVGLRVLALSLPAVFLLSTTDPVLMADGVQQHLKLPARYAMSMVVGLRLLPLMAQSWGELTSAQRARGMAITGPRSLFRSFSNRTIGLLVDALRRAVQMAMAMQARGFDPYGNRTFARRSVFGVGDFLALFASVAIVVFATWVSVRAGTWTFALTWPF